MSALADVGAALARVAAQYALPAAGVAVGLLALLAAASYRRGRAYYGTGRHD